MADGPRFVDDDVGPPVKPSLGIVYPIQRPDLSPHVTQEGETDAKGCCEVAIHSRQIHADPQNLCVRFDKLGSVLPEPGELFRSSWSEGFDVKGQHHVLLPSEVAEAHETTRVVRQREVRRRFSHRERPGDLGDADAEDHHDEADAEPGPHPVFPPSRASLTFRHTETMGVRMSPASLYAGATSTW